MKAQRVCWALLSPCPLVPWLYLGLFLRSSPCRAVAARFSCSSAAASAVPRWHFAITASQCWPLSSSHLGFVIWHSFLCQNTSGIPGSLLVPAAGTGPGFPVGANTAEQGISCRALLPAKSHCPVLATGSLTQPRLGAVDRNDRRLSNPDWQGRG